MKKNKRKLKQSGRIRPITVAGGGGGKWPGVYPLEVRRQAVRLHVEEGIPKRLIAEELGLCHDSVADWVKRYRALGEAGLAPRVGGNRTARPRLPAAVPAAIVALKREHPAFGVRRIAQWLRRSLLLPGSAETVRQTLHRQALLPQAPPRKPKRNPPKPRFFERATPNQMWQSDIFSFQLNGSNAYLLGFIDDHSRYIVGLGVYRGQTAENLLEVYRRAVAAHGVPKEMLTDNGRQYVAWHGKTRFQMALARDRVHHIRSAPHHPMTLGKIERFWKTIWEEFLERARFGTFEEAVERIGCWVQYYNHRRPHQGIDNLCPADRYFAIHQEVRQALERGIAANVEELALRGKPQTPFYMVGRVGGQNVVLQAERGQVRITVDGKDPQGGNHEQHDGEDAQGAHDAQRAGEVPGGAGALDGAAAALGDLPRPADPLEPALGLAGTGDGGYATGLGAAHAPAGGAGADAGPAHGAAPGPQAGAAGEPDRPAGQAPAGPGEAGGVSAAPVERSGDEGDPRADPRVDPAGARRDADRPGGGAAPGLLPQDVLPMGGSGLAGHAGGPAAGTPGAALDGAAGAAGPLAGGTAADPGGTGCGAAAASHP
jgi:transposase InsO family protein